MPRLCARCLVGAASFRIRHGSIRGRTPLTERRSPGELEGACAARADAVQSAADPAVDELQRAGTADHADAAEGAAGQLTTAALETLALHRRYEQQEELLREMQRSLRALEAR